ncbi:hypothetical protein LP420_36245 [Massilia sp. B-10]|nr:hypothetical protein LP420_36245 [Massilia sp. B-10]
MHALLDGRDAFAARVMMADAAERSLDVQYYIWRDDTTGTLLLDALRQAAGRGVRVRLLLDDNNTMRPGRPAGAARRAAEPGSAPVQSLCQPPAAPSRPGGRLCASEPAHAQQVVHGRRTGHHRGRAQRGRRVFRRHRRSAVCRSRYPGRGRGGGRCCARLRPLLEQRLGLSAGQPGGRTGSARWPRWRSARRATKQQPSRSQIPGSDPRVDLCPGAEGSHPAVRVGAGPAGERRSGKSAGPVDARDGPGLSAA